MRLAAVLIVLARFAPPAAADHKLRWKPLPTGSDQQYHGLDAVDERTAWVGGSAGEVLRTTDGGRTWKDVSLGPTGSDGARRWRAFDSVHYDAVDCVRRTCWASGPAGAVAVLK